MIVSVLCMFALYILVIGIYLITRYTLNRFIWQRNNIRVSLLNAEERYNGSSSRNTDSHRVSIRVPNTHSHSHSHKINTVSSSRSRKNKKRDPSEIWPNILDDELQVKEKLIDLSPEEQFYYKQGEEFIRTNPPLIIPQSPSSSSSSSSSSHNNNNSNTIEDPIVNDQTKMYIKEEGAKAWEFKLNNNLPNDTIIVENKTELTFLNYNYDASISTNLPIPRINRVYYVEFKLFELDPNDLTSSENSLISFGLATNPYPYFRLPGRHHHSIAYDSNGARRFNDSFKLSSDVNSIFPSFSKGDIIGIGYRSHSGTVFFTRNGKKLNEKPIGGHIKNWKFKYLYPIVGSNIPCKIHVNFGTIGFVYIEANVKKWGYGKTHGKKLPPPSYDDYIQDTLLESGDEGGEEDDEQQQGEEVPHEYEDDEEYYDEEDYDEDYDDDYTLQSDEFDDDDDEDDDASDYYDESDGSSSIVSPNAHPHRNQIDTTNQESSSNDQTVLANTNGSNTKNNNLNLDSALASVENDNNELHVTTVLTNPRPRTNSNVRRSRANSNVRRSRANSTARRSRANSTNHGPSRSRANSTVQGGSHSTARNSHRRNTRSKIHPPKMNLDIVDSNGDLLPPPPGFEFNSYPNPSSSGSILNHNTFEQYNLQFMPNDPPNYSDLDLEKGPIPMKTTKHFLKKPPTTTNNNDMILSNTTVGRSNGSTDDIMNTITPVVSDRPMVLPTSNNLSQTALTDDVFSDDEFTNELQHLLENTAEEDNDNDNENDNDEEDDHLISNQ
ncbi:hypothetical protein TBLA_0B07040 [Henningerozyma blattae CBS 6284]|uniref:B30.2/SPRY domain-containing protein n=1 Tax=Henningerozyma blattae (strain ATCC 34711 / CBS 6284 / DSM 70876 / NBRC 10599 / NRRL Y-10934 / UCD 77-7) TaxID=1071380 RepID=I2GZH1_HENB6|nr:hypothetical protein TBLA_0B07040 [Tetrapisispora blattae CBS 6284]CCH59523.1 hypothetical protein TBLA_0B07040 [Tetrapisispora blattae CBS 6284]